VAGSTCWAGLAAASRRTSVRVLTAFMIGC